MKNSLFRAWKNWWIPCGGEAYSLLLIADPVSGKELQNIKRGYEHLYSQLVPFAGSELSFGQNESVSVSNSVMEGLSESIGKSVTNTLTYTEGTSESHTEGSSDSVGVYAGVMIPPFGGGTTYNHGWNRSDTTGTNKNIAIGQGETISDSKINSYQKGEAKATGEGTSRNIQLKFENKAVKNLIEKIDLQLKRLDTSADTGMWNCSVYCLADNASTCKIVASSYQSLLRGENSSVETGSITLWSSKEKTGAVIPWLKKMRHPLLRMGNQEITPSSFISSAELAIHAGIPQTSVGGLPVLTMAAFGREVVVNREAGGADSEKDAIQLGQIYHMGKLDAIDQRKALPVSLNKNSLASHTFITGSTGSGKSNTVYKLLDEARRTEAAFLVIEPAKGEYKNVFGNYSDVSVYGTNPALTPLLRINPFTFPHADAGRDKNIHILEHLDRLIEIFNVCWPMYAAMPAVLKDAIEISYEEAGWDLRTSQCHFEPEIYPTFTDVTNNIRRIIESSDYSEENKGNYKGALITRLKSLCNGINGMIFTSNELSAVELFDKNVIVDLSRIGSMETKALIMGLLVMKLQEHRLTRGNMNAPLTHITVLEEAHNLLKRTSAEQSSESSNLLGKSVEMLANAIAEMRTYGEGFIIADQSPGLLDMSVIRNTNTKIILRLPDEGDRELVGKAASLNDDQIVELARLQCGVAAVYQNDWIQPVLCKVEKFETSEKTYHFDSAKAENPLADEEERTALKKRITLYLLSGMVDDSPKENIDSLKEAVLHSALPAGLKARIARFIESGQKPPATSEKIYDILAGLYEYSGKAIERLNNIGTSNIDSSWAQLLYDNITPSIADFPEKTQQIIMNCIIQEVSRQNKSFRDLPEQWLELGRRS